MIDETIIQQPDGSHREGNPAPLAFAQDGRPVHLRALQQTHRAAETTVRHIRLPIERLTEDEAHKRELLNGITHSGIDVAVVGFALAFGVGATVAMLIRVAAAILRAGAL